MRVLAICAVIAGASAGCLRSPEFQCQRDGECGAGGVCEAVGYCSTANAACPGDSAGSLSNSCVPTGNPGPGPDAGVGPDASPGVDAGPRVDAPPRVDAAIDAPAGAACASGYAAVGGSPHLYKRIADDTWDNAARDCKLTGTLAYLAIPDDATELANIVAVATTTPAWLGIDDKQLRNTFVTQKNAPATFLPWDEDEPNQDPPAKECVEARSSTKIATDRCGNTHAVVCECEP